MGEHLHQTTIAVLELLHVFIAKGRVIEGKVEAEWAGGHGRSKELGLAYVVLAGPFAQGRGSAYLAMHRIFLFPRS